MSESTVVTKTVEQVGIEVVERFFAAGERDDIDAAVACFTDDGVWITWDGPEPGTTYHRPQLPEFLTEIIGKRKQFEAQGIRIEYGEKLAARNTVFLEFSVITPAGVVVERGVDIFTIRDGLIQVKDVFRKA
jgi:uncharacterized protein